MSYRGRYAPTNYGGYGQNLLASRIYGQALPPWMDPGRQADTAGQGEDAMMQALLERLGMGGGGGGQGPMGPPQGPMGGGRSSIPGLEPEDPLDAMISRLQEEVMPSRALVGERGYDLPRFENPEYRGRKQEELDAVLEKKRKSDLAKRGFDPETEYRKGIIEGLNAGTRNAELLGTQIEHAKGQLARAMEEEANLRNPTNASFLSLPPKQQEQVRAEAAARTAAARNQVENAVQMQSGAIKNNAAMLGMIIRPLGSMGAGGAGGAGAAGEPDRPLYTGPPLTDAQGEKLLAGKPWQEEQPPAAKPRTETSSKGVAGILPMVDVAVRKATEEKTDSMDLSGVLPGISGNVSPSAVKAVNETIARANPETAANLTPETLGDMYKNKTREEKARRDRVSAHLQAKLEAEASGPAYKLAHRVWRMFDPFFQYRDPAVGDPLGGIIGKIIGEGTRFVRPGAGQIKSLLEMARKREPVENRGPRGWRGYR